MLHLHCGVQVFLSGSDFRAANVRALFLGRMSAVLSSRVGVVDDRLHRASTILVCGKATFRVPWLGQRYQADSGEQLTWYANRQPPTARFPLSNCAIADCLVHLSPMVPWVGSTSRRLGQNPFTEAKPYQHGTSDGCDDRFDVL